MSGHDRSVERVADDDRATPLERRLALGFILLGVLLRARFIFVHAVNSDEPQHLHTAWIWAQGQLAYRDFFDNHGPIFSALMAPIFGAFGERADIVILMRLVMVPLTVLALASMAWTARRLGSARAALWALAFLVVEPNFLRASVEYRTDQLWMALWVASLAILLSGRATRARCGVAGLALGLTLSTSLKSSLLLVSLALAAVLAWSFMGRERPALARMIDRGACVIAGLLVVPAIVVGYFASRGALQPLLYNTVFHNVVPGLGAWRVERERWIVLIALVPLVGFARWLVARAPEPGIGARRALVLLTAGFYEIGVEGFWPLVTRQDLLPFAPMAAMIAAWTLAGPPRMMSGHETRLPRLEPLSRLAPALVACVLAVATLVGIPFRDLARSQTAFLSDVLRLTRREDPVIDIKGESIYRNRPTPLVFETITFERVRRGLVRDDTPERLIATRTPVAILDDDQMPPRTRAFLDRSYIPVGRLRVAGAWLEDREESRRFEIGVPQRYAIVGARGDARGWLDGVPYRAPRDLAAGPHVFRANPGTGRLAAVWARAAERGFSPFPVEASR